MDFSNVRIKKISTVYEFQRPKGDVISNMLRSNPGMVIAENGEISYYMDGNEYIQTSDTVVLLPDNVAYSLYCREASHCYVINFEEESNVLGNQIQTVQVMGKNSILDKAAKIYYSWSMRSISHELITLSLIYGIFADMNVHVSMSIQQRKYHELIKPSVEFLESHYNKGNITIVELARISNISTTYFRRVFKKLYGVAPLRYMEIRKIENAKEFLASAELSVAKVAAMTGFKDVYYFGRVFKKATGFSPSRYRKEVLKQ